MTAHLEGQLRNIDLSRATTANVGIIEHWEGGGSHVNLTVAATGSPSGAAMLIVSIMATEITR